jgi:class 3 adenylate cyclase
MHTEEMAQVVEDPLQAGREAMARRAWREAYEHLSAARAHAELAPEDLESLAEAAWWTGQLEEALELRERAYAGYVDAGRSAHAALIALTLAQDFFMKGSTAVAGGWYSRAERLLEGHEDTVEYGYLAQARALNGMMGNLDEAVGHAQQAHEIGKRFGDRDLQAFALVVEGRARLLRGEAERGLALLDEATAAAIGGELKPFSAGFVYCVMITSCQNVGDYARAAQWTDEANRWCSRQDISGFPGVCRVHRAELMSLRGAWEEAESQARTACEEAAAYDVWVVGAGYYEIGEIRRRQGDFAAAEAAYRKAHEIGRDPQPGLALLQLAQGKVDAAVSALKRSLKGTSEPLARSRRLPALVSIALAAGDLKAAREAADELEETADRFRVREVRTPVFQANVDLARGQIRVAEKDWDGAIGSLQRAIRAWQEIGAPHEVARARMLLGMAYRQAGEEDNAMIELDSARATFERLGATLDVQRAAELLGAMPAHRTFVFTDIVDSTMLAEALGEEKWRRLLAWHDRTLQELIEAGGGEVIKDTGDGFFAAFDSPAAAVEAAVGIQRALAAHDGVAPDVRVGLHSGGAFSKEGDDYGGRSVHTAARIGALAGAGEILASRETVSEGVAASIAGDPRTVELRGLAAPIELVTIGWR